MLYILFIANNYDIPIVYTIYRQDQPKMYINYYNMLYRQILIYFSNYFIRDSPLITTGFKNHPDLKNNNKVA